MDYQRQAKVFRCLGNPVRFHILTLLIRGPLCVSDIVKCTRHRQAYVSQQLMVLRSVGWVETQKEGWNVCYRMADAPEARWLKRLIEEFCMTTEIE